MLVLKEKALKNENFDIVDNFVDYENFIADSYFSSIMHYISGQYDLLKNAATNENAPKDLFVGSFNGGSEKDDIAKVMNRTQDIKVVLPKYFPAKESPFSNQAEGK